MTRYHPAFPRNVRFEAHSPTDIGCADNGARRLALTYAHAKSSGIMFTRPLAAGLHSPGSLYAARVATLSFIADVGSLMDFRGNVKYFLGLSFGIFSQRGFKTPMIAEFLIHAT